MLLEITDPVCEDLSKPMSVNFAPLALTPFGLQGASGNLKEWVENTVRNDLGGNEYGKLMGGDFSNISDTIKKIENAIKSLNRSAKIFIILSEIREFKVKVIGHLQNPGFYTITPVSRVSDLYEEVLNKLQSGSSADQNTDQNH